MPHDITAPLPEAPQLPHNIRREAKDMLEGLVYYGILMTGVLGPILLGLYGSFFR
jgi:hypothetical protein